MGPLWFKRKPSQLHQFACHGNQGWEERDLWQAYDGEGQAGKDGRQGVRGGGAEESILMLGLCFFFFRMVAAWLYTKCQCTMHTDSTGMTGPWSVHGRAISLQVRG